MLGSLPQVRRGCRVRKLCGQNRAAVRTASQAHGSCHRPDALLQPKQAGVAFFLRLITLDWSTPLPSSATVMDTDSGPYATVTQA